MPWWYNERESVGILAGAIWKYGGDWVLEEFGTDKLAGPSKEKTFPCRCDIAFGVDGQDFWGEAKQCWPNLIGKNKSKTVETNLSSKNGGATKYQHTSVKSVSYYL
ncbi:MAG TPA: hypothetical protein VLG46_06690 [Anaerolineae bacterium]|nr:hypothetical protein [Anaerolineae bacterium]